jgi:hypothetical protein
MKSYLDVFRPDTQAEARRDETSAALRKAPRAREQGLPTDGLPAPVPAVPSPPSNHGLQARARFASRQLRDLKAQLCYENFSLKLTLVDVLHTVVPSTSTRPGDPSGQPHDTSWDRTGRVLVDGTNAVHTSTHARLYWLSR